MANAVSDVAYWKGEYDKAKAAGKGSDSLNWISQQAQKSYGQLDTATANSLKGMNAQQAAAYNQSLKAPTSSATSNGSTGGTSNAVATPQGFSMEDAQAMFSQWQQAQSAQSNSMTEAMNSYMAQAAAQAKQQNEAMQGQYNSLLGQYQTGQENELKSLDSGYETAKGELEDKSFQQYLNARQTMANRGLAGSGLANDQDTRLLMANSKNLAGLNNILTSNKASTTARYGSQMDTVRNQLAALQASYNN